MAHKLHNQSEKKEKGKKIPFTELSKKVYELVKKIPRGKVTTYKEIGKKLNIKAYRLIGKILSKNRNKEVPCHRVVNSNGFVGGYFGIKNNIKKVKILEKEGIEIKNNKINLDNYFFKLKI